MIYSPYFLKNCFPKQVYKKYFKLIFKMLFRNLPKACIKLVVKYSFKAILNIIAKIYFFFFLVYLFSILNSGDPWTYAAGGGHRSCPILCKSNNGHRVQMQKCIPLVIQTHTSYCFVETIYTYVCLCFFLVYHLLLFLLHASKNWKATAFEIGEVLHSCICI